MNRSLKVSLVSAASLVALASTQVQAQTATARNLYSFGDQGSTVGNDGWVWDPVRGYQGPTSTFETKDNRGWEFRFTNGPTWVERLGYYQGLSPALKKLQAPWGGFSGQYRGYNFAHYDADLDRTTTAPIGAPANWIQPAGSLYSFQSQIDYYGSQVRAGKIKTNAKDLFTFFNASVDPQTEAYFTTTTTKTLDSLRTVANAKSTILTLGSILPSRYFTAHTKGQIDPLPQNEFFDASTRNYNTALSTYARTKGSLTGKARTIFVDVDALIYNIRENPSVYDLKYAGPSLVTECIPNGSSCFEFTYLKANDTVSDTCFVSGAGDCNPNSEKHLFYSSGNLSSRGHDILAYYVASTLGGVYAWDQFRAVGSGTGAKALSATNAIVGAGTKGFAQSALGFAQANTSANTRSFALGFDSDVSAMGTLQARGGSLKLIGSTTQVTPWLSIGGATFSDSSHVDDQIASVYGQGGTGFATLGIGNGFDLNVLAASQSRTLNTNRQITFAYVGGIARSKTKVSLDVVQASLSRMFDVRGVRVGPVAGIASVNERWGETRETGVPDWLAANRDAGSLRGNALNLGIAADWSKIDKAGGQWSLSAKAGRLDAQDWTSIALLAPSQTLADALESQKGSATFLTVAGGRDIERGWSVGFEGGIAKTDERQVGAARARAVLRF